MRTLAIATFTVLAATYAAATTYESRNAAYVLSVTAETGKYFVTVSDAVTTKHLLDASFSADATQTMDASSKLDDGSEVRVHLRTLNDVLAAMVEVERNGTIVDSMSSTWATRPRPAANKMTFKPVSFLGPKYPDAMRVGGDVKAPVVTHRVEPIYSEDARRARVSGIVIIETLVDKTGKVADVNVLKPLPYGLDQAAVDAVKQWEFSPATMNGVPVDAIFNLTVNFKIDSVPPTQ